MYHNTEYQRKVDDEFVNFTPWDYDNFKVCSDEDFLYIHPSHTDYFKAQIDDLVKVSPLEGEIKVVYAKAFSDDGWVGCGSGYYAEVLEIIQRNNKHFFMPEVEYD